MRLSGHASSWEGPHSRESGGCPRRVVVSFLHPPNRSTMICSCWEPLPNARLVALFFELRRSRYQKASNNRISQTRVSFATVNYQHLPDHVRLPKQRSCLGGLSQGDRMFVSIHSSTNIRERLSVSTCCVESRCRLHPPPSAKLGPLHQRLVPFIRTGLVVK